MMANRIGNGILAGLVATIVLSVLMLIKSAMGMMPQVNAIQMLAKMGSTYAGLPMSLAVGWILHFIIGVILWGILFALLSTSLPGAYWIKGVVFSIGAWLLMMLIPMPMAGAGLFGANLGLGAPIATLILHLIFGAVLGGVFGQLQGRQRAQEQPESR